jgi:hypothetical protein
MSRLCADQMGEDMLTSEGKRLVADMSPVYGGVQLDCRFVQITYEKQVCDGDTLAERIDFVGRNPTALLLVALDLPLSAALDTLLLPVTLAHHFAPKPADAETPAVEPTPPPPGAMP